MTTLEASQTNQIERDKQIQIHYANQMHQQRSTRLKSTRSYYIFVLFFFGVLQTIAIAFFTRGFLLSRNVLDDLSTCSDQSLITGSSDCFHPSPYKKAVILVVDALRFDFTIPVDDVKENDSNYYYHNQFKVFYDTFINEPENSLLLKFIADPPTTTLQRLKGLTTGSLPTFIDAGSNFDGDTVIEDNLLSQLFNNGKRIAFAGDDTWTSMFSPYLDPNMSYPYDSLNVWDLHSVDNGVIDHIFPLLEKENKNKWDVLIGHFLGVDHCGHRYGPSHFSMKEKLNQIDSVIRKVMNEIDDETLLVVFGDHGMDSTGNHGGESQDEVEASLFMYSKAKTFKRLAEPLYDISKLGENYRKVNQIDLVSTLSLLLGIPIPFNNLGSPIAEPFIKNKVAWSQVSKLTSHQINKYRQRSFELKNDEAINDLYEKIINLSASWDFDTILERHWEYQQESLSQCKEKWATFDDMNINIGIFLVFISLVVIIVYSKLVPTVVITQLNQHCLISIIVLILVYTVLSVSFAIIFSPESLPLSWMILLGIGLGIANGILAPIMDRYSVSELSLQVKDNLIQNGWTYLGVLFILLHSLIFTSNSFIIWEDKITSFWLGTFGVLAFYKSFQLKEKTNLILGLYHSFVFVLMTKFLSMITICREEQGDKCSTNFQITWWCVGFLYLSAILLPTIIRSWFKLTSSYEGIAPIWITWGSSILLFLIAVLWTFEYIENDQTFASLSIPFEFIRQIKLVLARVVIGGSIVAGSFGWHSNPLCISVEVIENPIYSKPKSKLQSRLSLERGESPMSKRARILGYGNVYGSAYFLFLLNWFIAIACVTKPMGGIAMFLFMNQLISLLELSSILNIKTNLITSVVLVLMGYQLFFSTGHQATLQAIHWEIGFLLTETITFPFTHLTIFLNTLGPFILIGLATPLLTLWKEKPGNKPIGLVAKLVETGATVLIYQTFLLLSTLIMTNHFRRHLMVWKIFAPRYMLNALVTLTLNVVVTVGAIAYASGVVMKRWLNI